MNLGAAVCQRLRDDEPANTLAAGRIGQSRRLAALPAYVVQIVADPRPQHFGGFHRVRQSTVQVDAWGRTPEEAAALGQLAIAALAPAATIGNVRFQRAMITSVRSAPEAERGSQTPRVPTETHRYSIDFTFTHNAD